MRVISRLGILTAVAALAYGSIAIDVTVSVDQGSASTTVKTPAFSTGATNELLLAFIATDYLSGPNTTVTGVTGAGLTWVLVVRTNAQSGTSEIWRAFATSSLTSVSVTATLSQSVASSITIMSFTGADPSGTNGSGAIGSTASNSAPSGAPTATLITTRDNSLVLGVGNDYDNAIARTVGSGQSLVHQYLTPLGDTYWVQRQTNLTPASGTSVSINDTAPTGDRFNLSAVELLSASSAGSWTISGSISSFPAGVTATVGLSGPSSATTSTDSAGNYSFSGLANGTYTITPSSTGYTFGPQNQTVAVSGANVSGVNFTASAASAVLAVSSAAASFLANIGGATPSPYTVTVTNTGTGTFTYSAASDSAWLTASPATGAAPQQVQISASQYGLAAGTYTGHVIITASGAQNSPFTITVVFSVGVLGDWLMVDHDNARTGYALDETTITASNVAGLQLAWSTKVDGAVTAQPLIVRAIQIGGQTRDVVIVGTGGNTLYALDASNGSTVWTRNFGPPTPNTWGLPDGFGIEAPPVIDRIAGRMYTVSTDGNFHTLSLFDGSDVYAPLPLIANPDTNKVWGGANKIGNSVYIATGSNGGDVAPWRGQVYQVDVSGAPTLAGDFVVVPSIPAPNGGGGIWGYGGVSADLATGNVFAASAFDSNVNANGTEQYAPYSDSIIALNSNVGLLGYYQAPQPQTYPCSGAPCDLDFASTPVYFQPASCPAMVAAGNKNGNLYLFTVADLIAGGQPLQTLPLNAPNDDIGNGAVAGVPAFSAVNNMLYITDAGPGVSGVAAGVVGLAVTAGCTLQVAWSTPLGGNDLPNSTPTLANGMVFVGEGKTGFIHAYDAQTGTQLWQSTAQYGAAATFAAPVIAGGKLYAGSWATFSGGGIVGGFSLPATGPVLAVSPQTLSVTGTAGGADPAQATVNVTNTGTGTLSFTATSDSSWLNVSPGAGTAPAPLQASFNIAGLATGTYTGHITIAASGAQGSPAIVTATLTLSSGAAVSLAIDVNVSRDAASANKSIASPSFSTRSSNELLLAMVEADYLSGTNTTITGITGGGLTWVLVQRSNGQSGTAEIWRAFAPTPLTNIAATATLSQKVMSSITIVSFTGVDTSGVNGSGAIGAVQAANAATGAPSASLITTRNNSWTIATGNDYDNAIARVVGPGQTLIHQDLASVGDTYWVQMQAGPTPVMGTTVTINDTAPAQDRWNLAICEVLPHP